jgi:uncharacterized protein YndB with AHSA1/START domain
MIWAALTQASGLREWMCDGARSVPREGGLIQVWWNSGYEARGVFTAYSPLRTLAFTWLSVSEPAETRVKFISSRSRWNGHADTWDGAWADCAQ